jgi:Holliday junction resolvasome RuvABC endonuclease subunit
MKDENKTVRVLTIDPGTQALGWAVCDLSGGVRRVASGALVQERVKGRGDWLRRVDEMVKGVVEIVERLDPRVVVIEKPELFGSGRGMAAAGSGSVEKLMAMVYTLRAVLICDAGFLTSNVELVPVSRWKGQVPKSVTLLRVRRAFPAWRGTTHDEADALGIALWWADTRKRGV